MGRLCTEATLWTSFLNGVILLRALLTNASHTSGLPPSDGGVTPAA